MPRPKKCRWVNFKPGALFFKPRGIPMRELREIHLTMDELEAMRLADVEGKEHAEAAPLMGISRQTFGRILASAREKTARAIVEGHAIHIEGGVYAMDGDAHFGCRRCGHSWELIPGGKSYSSCPLCGGTRLGRDGSGGRKNKEQNDTR